MTTHQQLVSPLVIDPSASISCPACGAGVRAAPLERLAEFCLYPCLACDLHFWHPRKMPDGNWYERVYGSRDARLLPLEPGHEYFLSDPDAPKSGHLLDVGCGTGNFLLASRSAGFEVNGIELDPGAVRFIQTKLHVEGVFPLTITEFAVRHPAPKFSVITFFEVLEHQAEPAAFLKAIKSCLAPGGHIAISVPNRNRWLTGPDVLDYPPNHFLRWSPASIMNLLEAYGFELLTLREQPAGISHTAQMINMFLRTGFSQSFAGFTQPSFREVIQTPVEKGARVFARQPTWRQRLFTALSKVKLTACYALALVAWPFVRLRQLKGTYLYVLARSRN